MQLWQNSIYGIQNAKYGIKNQTIWNTGYNFETNMVFTQAEKVISSQLSSCEVVHHNQLSKGQLDELKVS